MKYEVSLQDAEGGAFRTVTTTESLEEVMEDLIDFRTGGIKGHSLLIEVKP